MSGVESASKNEYQDIPGGKGDRCVGVTTLPTSCVECLEIWEYSRPRRPVTGMPYLTLPYLTLPYFALWLRRLVTGPFLWRTEFNSRHVHMRYCVFKGALGQNIRRVLRGVSFHYNSISTAYLYFIRPKLYNLNKLLNKALLSHCVRKRRWEFEMEMNYRKWL